MSLIRRQFLNQFPPWIKKLPEVEKDWSSSLQMLEGYSNSVLAVAFLLDGQLLACASSNKTVRLWDANTGASWGILKSYSSYVYAVAFSLDGQLLTSASDDNIVRLWDANTRALRGTLEGYSSPV